MESGSLDVSEQVGIASHVVNKILEGHRQYGGYLVKFCEKIYLRYPTKENYQVL